MSEENKVERFGKRVIKTEGGNTVTILTALNAEKYFHLKNFLSDRTEIETVQDGYTKSGKPKFNHVPKITGKALSDLETETMRVYVIEFNGNSENAYDQMMATLNGEEYEIVHGEVAKLQKPEEKK